MLSGLVTGHGSRFTSFTRSSVLITSSRGPHVDENLHRAAADHALFAGLVGGEAELVERGGAGAQGLARLGPDLRLDAAAADRARGRAALEEEHLRAAPLRRR